MKNTFKSLLAASFLIVFLTGCGKGSKDPVDSSPPDFKPTWHDTSETNPGDTVTTNDNGNTPGYNPTGNDVTATGYTGTGNPILSFELNSADEIDEAKALLILDGIGLMGPDSHHKLSYREAMAGLCIGVSGKAQSSLSRNYTGPEGWGCKGIDLNDQVANGVGGKNNFRANLSTSRTMKEELFNQYQLAKEALNKYKDYPTISMTQTPDLFNRFLTSAAPLLTNVNPESRRLALMRSLMTSESGKTHWKNYRPVASQTAAFGIGQFLPSTAKGIDINPYDPEQNIQGIAKYLNQLISRTGSLRNALKAYNGSGPETDAYADGILSRL